jgi:signal transduction histidine kinase
MRAAVEDDRECAVSRSRRASTVRQALRSFDAVQALTPVAECLEDVADEENVTVSVTGRATLTADVELFRRAISNLLANAIRYTPPRGRSYWVPGCAHCKPVICVRRRSASAAQTAAALETS